MAEKKTKALEAVSLVDRLVVLIRDAIVSGEMEPGSRIGIKKVADTYGVSLIPVREALARLLSSRLVKAEANRGYFVASAPTAEEFSQLVRARHILETSALREGFSNFTKTDLNNLTRLNEKMRKLSRSGKANILAEWISYNSEFHHVLVGAARNSYLTTIFENLSLETAMARPFVINLPPFHELVDEHELIIEAIKSSDCEAAVQALSEHINGLEFTQ